MAGLSNGDIFVIADAQVDKYVSRRKPEVL
jgi:hypothetical protein